MKRTYTTEALSSPLVVRAVSSGSNLRIPEEILGASLRVTGSLSTSIKENLMRTISNK